MYLVDCTCSCSKFCLLYYTNCAFNRIDFKISELVVGELTNMREVPAKTTRSRKIRIVAGRRFWRFLLVNQLPLSIMAVHPQYRATALLRTTKTCGEPRGMSDLTKLVDCKDDVTSHEAFGVL